ncbi:MAG: GNAT family N-acetyltransferase [Candidatus Woesearchaeota archaeon]
MITNKAYFKELIDTLKKKSLSSKEVSRLKMDLCKKHKVKQMPTNIHILLNTDEKDLPRLKYLQTKPTRTISGVSVVALMTKPYPCPHANKALVVSRKSLVVNKQFKSAANVKRQTTNDKHSKIGPCIFCPGGPNSAIGDVPQSYTGNEPSTMRGIRNNYDSYLGAMNRLEQYVVLGHNFDKVELIMMGGTFSAFPKKYQEEFVMYAFKALNDFSDMFFVKKNKNYKKSKNNRDKDNHEYIFDVVKFRNFFLLPGDVGDEKRTKAIQQKLIKLKNKSKTTLEKEQKKNETAKVRCVGLTLETRPDCIDLKTANEMLRLGATRVEIGVQSVYDDVLLVIRRGHDVHESIRATKLLKDLGFKINYHMMPGLPIYSESKNKKDNKNDDNKNNKVLRRISYKKDLAGLKEIFSNPDYRPDMLKLYPCMVMKGTKLYEQWKKGNFKALNTEEAAELIAEFKKYIPTYCRIQRVQRDIPSYMAEDGVDKTNLRQYVEKIMADKNKKNYRCRCIRCREAGHVLKREHRTPKIKYTKLVVRGYSASKGVEWFISFEDRKQDILLGFCRLRLPSNDFTADEKNKGINNTVNIRFSKTRKEITKDSAFIRELHVIGEAVNIGKRLVEGRETGTVAEQSIQHKGLGKKLVNEAENIAKQFSKKKMIIISAVGTREYYKKLGYKLEGVYMVKNLK